MPLNKDEKKTKKAMEKFYGNEKGKQVFYATENKKKAKKKRK